jgi:hypothetical protein
MFFLSHPQYFFFTEREVLIFRFFIIFGKRYQIDVSPC